MVEFSICSCNGIKKTDWRWNAGLSTLVFFTRSKNLSCNRFVSKPTLITLTTIASTLTRVSSQQSPFSMMPIQVVYDKKLSPCSSSARRDRTDRHKGKNHDILQEVNEPRPKETLRLQHGLAQQPAQQSCH
jgi:hypothetical protein